MQAKLLGTNKFLKAAAAAVLAAMLVLMTAFPGVALAKSSSSATEAESATSAPLGGLPMMGDDYVWFGKDLKLNGHTAKNDLIAAGQNLSISECMANGSIRAAGQDVSIKECYVSENITVAGQYVAIKECTAKAVAAAASTASFTGSCEELTVFAEKVIIDGEVEGDVVVGASNVEIGENAHIGGTLHVNAANDPMVREGAEIGSIDFNKTESGTSTKELEGAFAGLAGTLSIMFIIMGIIATLLVAVLAEWLFRRQTAGAANMIRERTGATIGTGVIAALVAPLAIVILILFGITLPIAGALTLALLAMSVVAEGFAGASLFKPAFPKLGRFKCALAGGAIMGVASAIPFLGIVVGAAAFMYLLGYVLQSIFLGMRDDPRPPIDPTGYPAAEPISSVPVAEPVTPPVQSEQI